MDRDDINKTVQAGIPNRETRNKVSAPWDKNSMQQKLNRDRAKKRAQAVIFGRIKGR